MKKRSKSVKFLSYILRICVGILIGIIIFCVALYILQDKIVFMQQEISPEQLTYIKSLDNVQEINLTVEEDITLHGWIINYNRDDADNLLIYFGGNGEEVSYMAERVRRYTDYTTVLLNYRGYGLSEGIPKEDSLFSDSLGIYDYFTKKQGYQFSRVVVMGRSLGTGVATYLASNRKVNGVILVSPYDRLSSIASYRFPSFIPVDLLLKYNFDSIERAPSIKVPLTVITGNEDEIIPPVYSQKLASEWEGETEIIEIEGEGHNSLHNREEYWDIIGNFLDENKIK